MMPTYRAVVDVFRKIAADQAPAPAPSPTPADKSAGRPAVDLAKVKSLFGRVGKGVAGAARKAGEKAKELGVPEAAGKVAGSVKEQARKARRGFDELRGAARKAKPAAKDGGCK